MLPPVPTKDPILKPAWSYIKIVHQGNVTSIHHGSHL